MTSPPVLGRCLAGGNFILALSFLQPNKISKSAPQNARSAGRYGTLPAASELLDHQRNSDLGDRADLLLKACRTPSSRSAPWAYCNDGWLQKGGRNLQRKSAGSAGQPRLLIKTLYMYSRIASLATKHDVRQIVARCSFLSFSPAWGDSKILLSQKGNGRPRSGK